jgi:molybdopterin converting factor small subunit
MTKVNFTTALKRFFPDLASLEIEASSVSDLITQIDEKYPGIKSYILDDAGRLRKHVNIFIGENLIQDDESLSDVINNEDEIFIFQALSGG